MVVELGQHLKIDATRLAGVRGEGLVGLVQKTQQAAIQHKEAIALGAVQGRALAVRAMIVQDRLSGGEKSALVTIGTRQRLGPGTNATVIQPIPIEKPTLVAVLATVGTLAGMTNRPVISKFGHVVENELALVTNQPHGGRATRGTDAPHVCARAIYTLFDRSAAGSQNGPEKPNKLANKKDHQSDTHQTAGAKKIAQIQQEKNRVQVTLAVGKIHARSGDSHRRRGNALLSIEPTPPAYL